MSVSAVGYSSFTYSYQVTFYSVSISSTQGATSAPSETTNPSADTAAPTPVSSDQFKSDLTSLFQAVKSGDMEAARKALETVQADRPELFNSGVTASGRKAALQSDLEGLVSAVQSGDATAAQGALTKMQADVREGRGHHHHHRHHHDAAAGAGTPAAQGAAATSAAVPASGTSTGDKDGDGDGH